MKENAAEQNVPEILIVDDMQANVHIISLMVKAFSIGAVDYIAKPFQVEEVCAQVKTHLRLRRLQIETHNAILNPVEPDVFAR